MWAIAVQFLTGNCVATDVADREAAEWPPHPMRLFMAMAAAYFESPGDERRRAALQWLESLPAPDIWASDAVPRTVVTAFVPVNDAKGPVSMPRVRSRQPRTFPTTVPEHDIVYYAWETPVPADLQQPLEQVLCNVSRLGHSSSLVWSYMTNDFDPASAKLADARLTPWRASDQAVGGQAMRRCFSGALRQLESSYNLDAVNRHAELTSAIQSAKGVEKKKLKETLVREFGDTAPTTRRPESRLTARYEQVKSATAGAGRSVFDDDLLVLTQFEGPVIGSETTLRATRALRGAILSQFEDHSRIPEWISGHAADGSPSAEPHLAILPLPFVGHRNADGHLLGLALAFPRSISPRRRAEAVARLITDGRTGADIPIELRLGPLGIVTLQTETRALPPRALRPQTWTGPSHRWTTVTPLVLDRFPKKDRDRNRSAWLAEVAEIVAASCLRVGLPEPSDVAIHYHGFLPGVPSARPGACAFPPLRLKNGGSRSGGADRYMVHAALAFDVPVTGPVILGAGRFVGYGFCKPLFTSTSAAGR